MSIKENMEKIDAVMQEISKKRECNISYTDDSLEIEVDGVRIFVATILDHSIKVEMLPDIFTYSNFPNDKIAGQVHFNGRDKLSVYFGMTDCDVGDILEMIKDAIIDLNLYGYIVTD